MVLCLHVYLCPVYVPGVCGGYKRPSDTQELEFRVGVRCCVSAENQIWVLWKSGCSAFNPELALQPWNKTIKFLNDCFVPLYLPLVY